MRSKQTLKKLWFAWKFLSLWYQTQPEGMRVCQTFGCDLLENFYLCGIKHNQHPQNKVGVLVVICLKISIFVVSNTTNNHFLRIKVPLWFAWKFLSLWYQTQLTYKNIRNTLCCDLLENFYLCGIKHNLNITYKKKSWVVICLKISIFVVSNTTSSTCRNIRSKLWFAWKFLSLWYQTQPIRYILSSICRCDLLENFYLCGIKHNLISVICLIIAIYRDT